MVALMYPLTPLGDIILTRNHESVARAIEKFDGRKYDYTPRNPFEERYALYPVSIVERIRNQVSLSALKGLVLHLSGLREGRKNVIVVSEGYSNSVPPQLSDPVAALPGAGNPNRMNPAAGENDPRMDSIRFFEEADLQSDLRLVYDAANRSNTSLYTLDPRGLAVFEFDINEGVGLRADSAQLQSTMDTLRVLADNTDGRAIVNRNDLEPALGQIVRDASAYYLIGYNSTQAPSDGKFHEIKVRVKRPGVEVRARKGYWALSAEETARALAPKPAGPAPEVGRALTAIAEPPRGRSVRTWIGTSRGEGGKTRVTFVWEATPPVPGVKREEPAKLALTALAADGAPYFKGLVPDLTAGVANGSADGGTQPPAGGPRAPARARFDVAPGRVQLRMNVQTDAGTLIDSTVQEIVVPDFTAPQIAMSTPSVLRGRTAVETRRITADAEAVPTALREFRRTDRLLVRLEVYGPGGSVPAVASRLLNRTGQRMADLPVQAPPTPGALHQIDLPLAGLAVGEYLVEIVATLDGADAKELVAFRVGS
jgi:VWFA-related protein